MKKSLLFAFAGVIALSAGAQIEKKDVLLGGSFGIGNSTGTNQSSSSSNSNIQPYVQFAYKKNRTIGFGLDFTFLSNQSNEGENKQEYFALAPNIGFNQFHPIKGNFGWVLQEYAGASFHSNTSKNGSETTKIKGTSVFAGITPGLYYVVGERKNWLLQANVGNLGGSYYKQSNADYSTWSFHTNLFQSYRFGFAYIFKK